MEEARIILAIRVRDFAGAAPARRSTQALCPVCGEAILLSPGSRERIKRGWVAYCSICAAQAIVDNDDGGPVEFELPTAAEWADAHDPAEPD